MSPHFSGAPPTKMLVLSEEKIDCALCDVMVLCIQFCGLIYTDDTDKLQTSSLAINKQRLVLKPCNKNWNNNK